MSCLVELHFTSSGEYFKTLDQQQYITVNIKMYYKNQVYLCYRNQTAYWFIIFAHCYKIAHIT